MNRLSNPNPKGPAMSTLEINVTILKRMIKVVRQWDQQFDGGTTELAAKYVADEAEKLLDIAFGIKPPKKQRKARR
jgi:hypothetical protein